MLDFLQKNLKDIRGYIPFSKEKKKPKPGVVLYPSLPKEYKETIKYIK